MKESVLDVLKFLFETTFDPDCNPPISSIPDRDALKTELETAGFNTIQVEEALRWLPERVGRALYAHLHGGRNG